MNKLIEKIVERLEEYEHSHLLEHDSEIALHCKDKNCGLQDCSICVMEKAIDIIHEEAKAYNEEVCEWKFVKSVVDGCYVFSSGCNHKRFYDLHNFEFCPYCGKKIKVVE